MQIISWIPKRKGAPGMILGIYCILQLAIVEHKIMGSRFAEQIKLVY